MNSFKIYLSIWKAEWKDIWGWVRKLKLNPGFSRGCQGAEPSPRVSSVQGGAGHSGQVPWSEDVDVSPSHPRLKGALLCSFSYFIEDCCEQSQIYVDACAASVSWVCIPLQGCRLSDKCAWVVFQRSCFSMPLLAVGYSFASHLLWHLGMLFLKRFSFSGGCLLYVQ